jgi:hypothetical protein
VVEGARLERVWAGNRLVGSNPTLSATLEINSLISLDKNKQLNSNPGTIPGTNCDLASNRPHGLRIPSHPV